MNQTHALLTSLAARKKMNRARGVTLIEVLIVLAIIGLIAGGVVVFAFPQLEKAKVGTAKNDTKALYQAIETWKLDHTGCPTVEGLKKDKALSTTSNTNDPWGQPYKVQCDEDGAKIAVYTIGPDKKENTADDIRVPEEKEE